MAKGGGEAQGRLWYCRPTAMFSVGEPILPFIVCSSKLSHNRVVVAPVEYTIVGVERAFRATPWEHVEFIFCREANGPLRKMSYSDALQHVASGTARFCIIHLGRQVELELARNALGYECLQATIDGQKNEILLGLPDYRDRHDP